MTSVPRSAWASGDFVEGGRKITRNRKPRPCETCERDINPGERYVRTYPKAELINGVLMTEFDNEATCLDCCSPEERELAAEKKLDGCQ